MEFVSKIKDNNIFHIFLHIVIFYDSSYSKVFIYCKDLNLEDPCQKWRYFVMQKLYNLVFYSTNKIEIHNKTTYEGYDCWNFIKYNPCPFLGNIYNILSPQKPVEKSSRYILLNQRNIDNRYLYDYNTKEKLENYLLSKNLKLPLKICNFINMSPSEQYEICSNSAVFISAHGAGCTNLIFTPKDTPFIEINFRKHWYCDNVCDDHFYNKISINEKCEGTLNYRSYFHKADYHNLCHLIEKKIRRNGSYRVWRRFY